MGISEQAEALRSATPLLPDPARQEGYRRAVEGLVARSSRMGSLGRRMLEAVDGWPADTGGMLVSDWMAATADELESLSSGSGDSAVSEYYAAELCLRFAPVGETALGARTALSGMRHDLLLLAETGGLLRSAAAGGNEGILRATGRELSLALARMFPA